MEVKVFEKGGAILVAEVIETNAKSQYGCNNRAIESWYVKNPKVVQAFQAPDRSGRKMLNIQLLPTVYTEFLKDSKEGFKIFFDGNQYQDVTEQFNDHLVEMYRQIAEQSVKKDEGDDTPPVELFTDV